MVLGGVIYWLFLGVKPIVNLKFRTNINIYQNHRWIDEIKLLYRIFDLISKTFFRTLFPADVVFRDF